MGVALFNPEPVREYQVKNHQGDVVGRVEVYRSGWKCAWRENGDKCRFDEEDAAVAWLLETSE